MDGEKMATAVRRTPGLRIAVLVKQVPRFEAMELGPDGRLRREGLELEMNPYCRRAVTTGVRLARETEGHCTVLTLGPPPAEDVLREAVAGGADEGVLVSDPLFAGSDTLATARALALALRRTGPFDLVLCGRNSVDADTGQVPPELAQLLDLPFAGGVRSLEHDAGRLHVRCEHDDGFALATLTLPAVLSCAERLCEPTKVDPEGRRAVPASRIRRLGAADLGEGPWGQEASPTRVGSVRRLAAERLRLRWDAPLEEQVRQAVAVLTERRALDPQAPDAVDARVPDPPGGRAATVAVVGEPGRERLTRELLGRAAGLAAQVGGGVALVGPAAPGLATAWTWGADAVARIEGPAVEEDVAAALTTWCAATSPWAVLLPGTMWGREVAARTAAALGAGLVGDVVDLDVEDGRLVGWKPAFGGSLVAAITCSSPVQMATVRAGVLPLLLPRTGEASVSEDVVTATARGRVTVSERSRVDELDVLATAEVLLAVGSAVAPEEYPLLEPLRSALGAELAATRKVTDKGWLPRSRQVGITGRSVSPRLYVAVAVAGKFNHIVGTRGAGTVLAVNRDPGALVFEAADAGIVGDWHEVLPLLVDRLPQAARTRP